MTSDLGLDLELWQRLLAPEYTALRAEAAACDPTVARELARLRANWPREVVTVALELAAARRKGAGRLFPSGELVADVPGVEMATGARVAAHKAARFRVAGAQAISDLCCGIGGDLIELCKVAPTLGYDLSPTRAWMAGLNSAAPTACADAAAMALDTPYFHIDPARRNADPRVRTRARRLAEYQPGPNVIARILRESPNGAIKLGPGIDFEELRFAPDAELEFVSDGGELVQAVLWCGALAHAPGERTATRLPQGLSYTGTPARQLPIANFPPRYLHVADPALERAQLLASLCVPLQLGELAANLGVLASADPVESPWLTSFEIVDQRPWHDDDARAWLKSHDARRVEIKTRDAAADANQLTKTLRRAGATDYTLFVLRLGRSKQAYLTRRRSG
ncbi:MAG: THUMP-like domain-containing protein [Planctomycetota bacterium]